MSASSIVCCVSTGFLVIAHVKCACGDAIHPRHRPPTKRDGCMSHIGMLSRLAAEDGTSGGRHMIPIGTPARVYQVAITAMIGLITTGIGVWCLIDPYSF